MVDPAAAAPTASAAAASNPPELELSPISKGFVGKGPRSRPSSARPYILSSVGELPRASDSQLEIPSSGPGQPSSFPAHSNASLSLPSSGNANSSGGQGLASTSGDGGPKVTVELTARLSGGGRSSGGGDAPGLTKRRSRSLSLSREQGQGLDVPPQQQQGVGLATPEPEVQPVSTTAEGDSPLFWFFVIICALLCSPWQCRLHLHLLQLVKQHYVGYKEPFSGKNSLAMHVPIFPGSVIATMLTALLHQMCSLQCAPCNVVCHN